MYMYTLILSKLPAKSHSQPLLLNMYIQHPSFPGFKFLPKKELVDILLFVEEGGNFLEMKLKHFSERKKKRHIHLVCRNHKNLVVSRPSIESLSYRNWQDEPFRFYLLSPFPVNLEPLNWLSMSIWVTQNSMFFLLRSQCRY